MKVVGNHVVENSTASGDGESEYKLSSLRQPAKVGPNLAPQY